MKPLLHSCILLSAICLSTAATNDSSAHNVNLIWDPSPDANVVGYAIYYGTASGTYATRQDVGDQLTTTVPNLTADQTYYFVAVAYDANGLASDPSNEVSAAIPAESQSSPATLQITSGTLNVTSGT